MTESRVQSQTLMGTLVESLMSAIMSNKATLPPELNYRIAVLFGTPDAVYDCYKSADCPNCGTKLLVQLNFSVGSSSITLREFHQ